MKEIVLPPYSTCQTCRNRMNDLCLEECAPAKDYSHFGLRKINLEDMPAFPLEDFVNGMSARVRGIVVAVYITKILEVLQGRVEHGTTIANRPRSVRLPHVIPLNALLDDPAEGNTPHQVERTTDSDTAV